MMLKEDFFAIGRYAIVFLIRRIDNILGGMEWTAKQLIKLRWVFVEWGIMIGMEAREKAKE